MAGDIKITGLDDLIAKLKDLGPKMRKRVVKNSINAAARIVRDSARREAPVLKRATKTRTPGLLQKSIIVRNSKRDRRAGAIGAFVNVRPAKGIAKGAKTGRDPFYWRFVEFGTRKMDKKEFLKPSGAKLPQALDVFKAQMVKWFDKVNSSGKVNP